MYSQQYAKYHGNVTK